MAGLYALIIGTLQWWKYIHFGYNGLDLGIYSQVVWSLAHGHGFASSIHDPSYLGDHLELWLLPLSWLYKLWSSPLLLLWAQTLVLASSVFPIYLVAKKTLGPRLGMATVGLFLLNPLLYNTAMYEFHGLVFALPLLCWTIYFYINQRYSWWLVSLIAIAVVREDMPLVVAGWTIMSAIDRRSWKWWIAPIVIAGAWFPIAQQIIRQANHDGTYKYLAFYQWLGKTPLEMLTYPFRHPYIFLTTVVSFNNVGTILGMAATTSLLCLFQPRRLWPLAIIVVQLLLANASPTSFLHIHYTIPYLPFIIWAAIEAYPKARQHKIWIKTRSNGFGFMLPVLIVLGPLYTSFIFGAAQWPWSSTHIIATTPTTHLKQALDEVRPKDRVLTTFAFLPQLSSRTSLYSLNYIFLGRRQYSDIPYSIPTDIDVAIIDWQQLYEYQFFYRTTVFRGQSGMQRIRQELEQQGLHQINTYGTVAVYKKNGAVAASSAQQITDSAAGIQQVKNVELLHQPTITLTAQPDSKHLTATVTSVWRSTQLQPDSIITLRIVAENAPSIVSVPQILGQGLIPSSEWAAGTVWTTTQSFVLPATHEQKFRLEVIDQRGTYTLNRTRTFRPVIKTEKIVATFKLQSPN